MQKPTEWVSKTCEKTGARRTTTQALEGSERKMYFSHYYIPRNRRTSEHIAYLKTRVIFLNSSSNVPYGENQTIASSSIEYGNIFFLFLNKT